MSETKQPHMAIVDEFPVPAETKHTLGPWVADLGEAYKVRDSKGGLIAILSFVKSLTRGRRPETEVAAHALLIAAAPDLLAESVQAAAFLRNGVPCEGIANVRSRDTGGWERWDCIEQDAPKDEWCERCTNLHGLDAAIAKARGEA